jgi:hypothetical protein
MRARACPNPRDHNMTRVAMTMSPIPAAVAIAVVLATPLRADLPEWLTGDLTAGGELRHRYYDEADRLRPGGPGTAGYQQWRWRNWLEYQGDGVGGYVELIDASTFGENPLPETGIDVNRWDLQAAYLDLDLFERDGHRTVLRSGRQQLLYGSQRLISPPDFANIHRNWEGFRLMSPGETWDIDAFATRPVNLATGNGPVSRLDHERDRADASRTFSGVYATHHGIENHTFDVYWLWLREQDEDAQPPRFADGSRHTIGLRWAGKQPVADACGDPVRAWDWDVEGAYQFGHDEITETVRAGFFVATLGHTWTALPWKPRLAAVYYFGSGDDDPADDENNTFSTLFPLGHGYWGLIDNLSGQNLIQYSLQATITPHERLSFGAQLHWFELASNGDVLYNVAGAPLGTPGGGLEVGEELDLLFNYQLTEDVALHGGYSWFWYGSFVDNRLPRDDASLFYIQTTWRY